MKKFLFFGLIISVNILGVFAQERGASFSFKEEKYNFGNAKEEDGSISHVFEFTNTGGTPLIISNVQASCGCTTPDWSKQPVAPGAKGFVKATFNPSGRPGSFTKTVTITSNVADKTTLILTITGTVVGKPLGIEQQYPFAIGDLRFRTSHVGFQTLSPGMVKTDTLEFTNPGQAIVNIGFPTIPEFLKVQAIPSSIKPKEKGKLIITYNSTKRNDWNFLVDYLYLTINGKQDPKYRITITADIEEDFSKLTPKQLANAPKIKFDKGFFEFGTVKAGEKLKFTFTYKNEGKSDLILRKIENSCSCATVAPSEKSVKAGASGTLNVTLDTKGQTGAQNKAITLITNDPSNRKMIIYIRGNVN